MHVGGAIINGKVYAATEKIEENDSAATDESNQLSSLGPLQKMVVGSISRLRLEELFLCSYGPGILLDIEWEAEELWRL